MWHAIWSLPSWFIGALGLLLVGAVLLGRWGVKAILEDRRIDAEPDPIAWRKEVTPHEPQDRIPVAHMNSPGLDWDSSRMPAPEAGGLQPWHERMWWDDPDLTVWDARQAALRCWEILHIEFPRLRAELGCPA